STLHTVHLSLHYALPIFFKLTNEKYKPIVHGAQIPRSNNGPAPAIKTFKSMLHMRAIPAKPLPFYQRHFSIRTRLFYRRCMSFLKGIRLAAQQNEFRFLLF